MALNLRFYALFQAVIDPADEVIIPVPYWVSYAEQVKLAGGHPVFVYAAETEQFKVTVSQLEAVRTAKTKAIILNSPLQSNGGNLFERRTTGYRRVGS